MKVHVRPGTPISDVSRRQIGASLWLPSISPVGAASATTTRPRVSATASVTPHTLGSWTEVLAAASVTKDIHMVLIDLQAATNLATNDSSTLLNISTGGAGSEATNIAVANIGVGYNAVRNKFLIPVHIPAGSRISVACQSAIASQVVDAVYQFYTLPFGRIPPRKPVTIGANTATSKGVGLTPPGSSNTKSAWTEITSATTQPLGALVTCVQGNSDTIIAADTLLLDIGIGSAGNEVVVVGDICFLGGTSEIYFHQGHINLFGCDIPAGTRIAARYANSGTSDGMDLILLGVPKS